MPNYAEIFDRYLSFVEIPSKIVFDKRRSVYKLAPDSKKCWVWSGTRTGGPDGRSYGNFWFDGKNVLAHRVGWFFAHGSFLPSEICVCHICDYGLCQNPDHWFSGTKGDNHRDKLAKGRANSPQGDRHWKTRISDEDVVEVRRRFDGSRGQISALAREYGVHRETMRGIIRGHERTHTL